MSGSSIPNNLLKTIGENQNDHCQTVSHIRSALTTEGRNLFQEARANVKTISRHLAMRMIDDGR